MVRYWESYIVEFVSAIKNGVNAFVNFFKPMGRIVELLSSQVVSFEYKALMVLWI